MNIFYTTLITLLLISCGGGNVSNEVNTKSPEQINSENQAIWQSNNTGNYSYTFKRLCNCPAENTEAVFIKVVNDNVVSIIRLDDSIIDIATFPHVTLDGAFNLIADALNKNAFKVKAIYNGLYNTPRYIEIDFDELVVDDEVLIRITDLVIQ